MGQYVNRDHSLSWDSAELPNIHMIGNLPFNISTPLLFKLLLKISDQTSVFSCGRVPMTFLFQEEFGERMIAPPGYKQRSRVSVLCQAFCDVSIKFIVPSKEKKKLAFCVLFDSDCHKVRFFSNIKKRHSVRSGAQSQRGRRSTRPAQKASNNSGL